MQHPQAKAPMGRADQVLVKTEAACRFLVSESLTLPCPGVRGRVPHQTPYEHNWMRCASQPFLIKCERILNPPIMHPWQTTTTMGQAGKAAG
jgi:hypothetical protein